jgi:tetratricopeptide (TPR) repeat protein
MKLFRTNYSDVQEKAELIEETERTIRRHDEIKRRVAESRERAELPRPPNSTDADTVLIVASPPSPWLHHHVTEADIRAVLRRLPPGCFDGLGLVQLSPPLPSQRDAGDRDPFLGLPAGERLPGIYANRRRGIYRETDRSISLYPFIHEAGAEGDLALYLKVEVLHTLVHELSHHFDFAFRTEGDRWRMDQREKTEEFAIERSFELFRDVVAPWLEETYPQACAAFRAWMERHGGVAVPLAEFARDTPTGHSSSCDYAVRRLAADVHEGGDPVAARVRFGRLLYDERVSDELALRVLDAVLAEHPTRTDALRARLFIHRCELRFGAAAADGRAWIALEPESPDAWEKLGTCLAATDRRREAIEVETTLLSLLNQQPRLAMTHYALFRRALAALFLADWTSFDRDLEELRAVDAADTRVADAADLRSEVEALEVMAMSRRGQLELALARATHLLGEAERPSTYFPELRVVRFQCLRALGSPAPEPLSSEDREELRSYYPEWSREVEGLVADRAQH